LTSGQLQSLIEQEVDRQLAVRLKSDIYNPPSNIQTPTPQSESTSSAALASSGELSTDQLSQQTDETLSKLDELLATKDLTLSTLTLGGQANLAATQVAGTFSQDGTLIIDYGRQINVLAGTLYLQNDSLAGLQSTNYALPTTLLDVGDGAAVFDKQGNLRIAGTLTAEKVETKQLVVNTDEGSAKTVGSAQLANGQRQITIFTSAVRPEAKILITPTTPTQGRTLYIAQKSDFEGFTVALDGSAAASTIRFDWLIINTNQVSQAN